MNQGVMNLIAAGVLGIVAGCVIGFMAHRYKLFKDKKNRLDDIGKQKIVNFQIPKIVKGKSIQEKVNLHELVGLGSEKVEDVDEQDQNKNYNDYSNSGKDKEVAN